MMKQIVFLSSWLLLCSLCVAQQTGERVSIIGASNLTQLGKPSFDKCSFAVG